MMPAGLPSTRARMMPTATGSVRAEPRPSQPPTATPAEKKAKTGTAMPAEIGRNRCSKISARPGPASGPPLAWERSTGTAKPSSTPATVAWMPEACTSAQVTTPSGSRISQAASGVWCRRTGGTSAPGRCRPPAGEGQQQRHGLDVAGVEHRDDGDGEQVIHHGQGQQEDPQRAGQVGADDRQHGDGECDVRGGGDGPAAQGLRAGEIDGGVDQRRDGHAAHGGGDGHHGFAELAQVAGDEFALEFEARPGRRRWPAGRRRPRRPG